MSYADVEDVKARAGALRGAWDDTTEPSDGDIERFIRDAEAAINIAMASKGFPAPSTNDVVVGALAPVAADMALMMTLAATWPGDTGSKGVNALYEDVRVRVEGKDGKGGYLAGMTDGTLAAFVLLRTENQGDATGATSFWEKEPGYSSWLDDLQSQGAYIDATGSVRFRTPLGPSVHKDTRF